MIVYEREHDFVLVKQYDHSELAGEFAKQLNLEWLGNNQNLADFQLAVKEHDRGWVDLDEVPIWNDIRRKPFGVEDLPLLMRLPFYLRGLDEIKEKSEYAALLVSMHYTTFRYDLTNVVGGIHDKAKSAIGQLMQAQLVTRGKLGLLEGEGAKRLEDDFLLFQFLDELSLYLCLQDLGTPSESAVYPRKGGFQLPEHLVGGKTLIPEWVDEGHLILDPFPFQSASTFTYRAKIVPKSRIQEIGLAPAYAAATEVERTFTMRPA